MALSEAAAKAGEAKRAATSAKRAFVLEMSEVHTALERREKS